MLTGSFRDVQTLVWTILFPVAMLLGLGLYRNDRTIRKDCWPVAWQPMCCSVPPW